MTGEPPFDAGAVQETVAVALPGTAVTFVGTPGTVAAGPTRYPPAGGGGDDGGAAADPAGEGTAVGLQAGAAGAARGNRQRDLNGGGGQVDG